MGSGVFTVTRARSTPSAIAHAPTSPARTAAMMISTFLTIQILRAPGRPALAGRKHTPLRPACPRARRPYTHAPEVDGGSLPPRRHAASRDAPAAGEESPGSTGREGGQRPPGATPGKVPQKKHSQPSVHRAGAAKVKSWGKSPRATAGQPAAR